MSTLLVLLTFLLTLPGDGSGSVVVQITVHSYLNDPAGRCAECQPGPEAGCCDEDFVRPANETCPFTAVCDPIMAYCIRLIGGACVPHFTPLFIINGSSFDFDARSFLGRSNTITFGSDAPWNGGEEFVLTPSDCGNPCTPEDSIPIDEVPVSLDVPVGTRRVEQIYTGNAGLAHFIVSFSVLCADGDYGADCTTPCGTLFSCAVCGLSGFTGEFCQFPTASCSEDYCNGNGECEDGSPTCDCEPGFEGDQCEINIDDCEGQDCGNGRCEDEVNSFECLCVPGYTGDRCEVDINECEGVNCGNGRCEDGVNSFECICNSGFTGETCGETDFCSNFSMNCSGNGACMNFPDRFVCVCEEGYTGDLCDMQLIASTTDETSVTSGNQGTGVSGANSATTAAIAGGVVGGVIGLILVAIIIVLVVVIVSRGRSGKGDISGSGNHEAKIFPGDNPAYGARGDVQVVGHSSRPPPSHNTISTVADNGHGVSMSLQERDFDNPIYASDPMEDADDPYTMPDSPPNIYDRVADDQLGHSPHLNTGNGDHETSAYYSTVRT